MKFGVPWRVKGIRPEARETASEAARRSGMPLGDWLTAVILRQAAQQGLHAQTADESHGDELAALRQQLDELTRRVEQMSRTGPAAYAPKRTRGDAAPADDLVGRYERRLDQFARASRPVPPLAPNVQLPPGLEHAVAEIAARQRALDTEPAPASGGPQQSAPPATPSPAAAAAPPAHAPLPAQNLSGLEEQLRRITEQIETLRRPGVEEAINALRAELIEIGNRLNEAMPRREIETIEKQIASLSQRIAEGRQNGVDHDALAGVEHGLAEVRDALRGLTPAEQLVGFHDAIDGLAHKLDLIVAQKDPETMAQLQSAVTTLREMATHIASSEAVSNLAAEVQLLGQKVDYIAHATTGGTALDSLEHRVTAIADALAERAQSGAAALPQLEALVQSLSDKIEQIQSSRSDDVAIGHLEDRIAKLVEKLDASESRLGQLEAIERGMSDLLVHIEDMRANKQASGLRAENFPAVDELKHDIARTQDAVDGVNGTLALVVDRLAKIEADIRAEGSRRAAEEVVPAPPAGKPEVQTMREAPPIAPAPPPTVPEPPHVPKAPALQMPPPQPPAAPQAAPAPEPAPLQLEESQIAAPPPQAPAPAAPAPQRRAAGAPPLNSDLPPDQPLEPGSGPPKFSARIAASEAALGAAAPVQPGTAGGKSSFIAAARRAAQAAMRQESSAPAPRNAPEEEEIDTGERRSLSGKLMKRMKSLFVAAAIIALVVGAAQIIGHKFQFGGAKTAKTGKAETHERVKVARDAAQAPLSLSPDRPATEAVPPLAPPPPDATAAAPTFNLGAPTGAASSLLSPPDPGTSAAPSKGDITGSIAHNVKPPASTSRPAPQDGESLPPAIGGAKLRKAAIAGNGAAEYEVGVRFAEGRGVPANQKEAAHWFERAAGTGLALAQFRYGSMLEKGVGVKKDVDAARRLYLAAATQGNAKAMHNLAVLYAEGIEGKPDYAAAAKWFRKAAQRGIADSQYNLGVLCARGLGTKKDFVESYKWFALAGAKGDPESAKKRDEVATHLDPAQLTEAKEAVKAFKAEPQPAAAITVPRPHGGWDTAAATHPTKASARPRPHRHPQPQGPLSLGSFTVGTR